MLELSCAEYTFPLLPRSDALALLHLLRFSDVDIGLFERSSSFRPSALRSAPRSFAREVTHDLEAASLRVADVFLQAGVDPSQLSANDPDQNVRIAARDAFELALEFCAAVHCLRMTGLPGVPHGDPSRDVALAAEETVWRIERAAEADIVYSVEAHLGSICSDTKSALAFLKAVPGLTLTLDYGHFIFQGEANEAIHALLPYASHVHLRGAAPGRLQASSATSTVDLHHIVCNAPSRDRGMFAMEYVWSEWHGCNQTDNLSETVLMRQQAQDIEAKLASGEMQHV